MSTSEPLDQKETFESLLKLATDNKLTSSDVWNVALIDYFADFNVLRDGDSINFQRASTTLDGCMRIYSNRVESAVHDTGVLLYTLNHNQQEESLDEVEKPHKAKKRIKKDLANSFDSLKLRDGKGHIIDPMFKNLIVEFDEGGAKGMLNNLLHIDKFGRIVTDQNDVITHGIDGNNFGEKNHDKDGSANNSDNIDWERLHSLVDWNSLHDSTVCPSWGLVQNEQIDDVNSKLEELDVSFLEEEQRRSYQIETISTDYAVMDVSLPLLEPESKEDNDIDEISDADDDNNDADANTSRRTNYSLLMDVFDSDDVDDSGVNQMLNRMFDPKNIVNEVQDLKPDLKLIELYDNIGSRSELYWKIARVRRQLDYNHLLKKKHKTKTKKTDKEKCIIDFNGDFDHFENTDYLSHILLPERDRNNYHKHLLPHDSSFSAKKLAYLTLKPKQLADTILLKRRKDQHFKNIDLIGKDILGDRDADNLPANEEFFADNYQKRILNDSILSEPFLEDEYNSNDNDHPVFEDPVGFEFDEPVQPRNNKYDSIPYDKRVKKVDVRLLKHNLWDSIESSRKRKSNDEKTAVTLKFTEIVEKVSSKYDTRVKQDLSTSFCFICLLHLANEQGLTLENKDNFKDLLVHRA